MTRVGSYRVIETKRLLIPKGLESWIQFMNGNEAIDIQIIFENSDDAKASATLSFVGHDKHGQIILKNWNNTLGQSTASPVPIGETDAGEPLSFMAASWMIGETRIVEVQMMAGGAE